jgi:uncharacterized protein (DUF342 family)
MAEGYIDVPQLGSVTYTKTFVHAGCDFKTEERQYEIHREQEKVEQNEAKVKKALYTLSKLRLKLQGNLPAEQQKLYERLQETMNYYPKYREKLNHELKDLDAKAGEHKNAYVKVTGLLHPGVKVAIGKFSRVFNEKQGHATLREVKGEIVPSA